jgi:CHAT domain-containing protein/tetratricopeptide (TPR) repeat protein
VAGLSVEARAWELHRTGLDAVNRGSPTVGARALRHGLRLIGWPAPTTHTDLAVRLLGSLAAAEVAQGHTKRAFSILDDADTLLTPANRGVLLQQRGLLQVLVGRMDEALECFDEAVRLLPQAGEEVVALARALLNRAFAHQLAGHLGSALADLTRIEQLDRTHAMPVLQAKAVHIRGSCRLLTGDIPGAQRAFAMAARQYAEHNAEGMQVVLSVELARAMLAAGLYGDAAAELDTALELFPPLGMNQEYAEAELTRARVAYAAGDPEAARTWARHAELRFRRRGNDASAAVAVLARLRAEFALGASPAAIAAKTVAVADTLRSLKLSNDAESASVLAARAFLADGDGEQARRHLARRSGAGASLETRLQRRLAWAELASANGDRGAVFRHARTGLTLLREHRGRFGSLDLQTGSTALGNDLARAGLASALESGNPAVVFGWLERSRAQAFRSRAVHPPADATTIELLAELRQLAMQVRTGELSGRRLPEVRRRCAKLERQIRARTWQTDGTGEHSAEATLAETIADLAASGTVLVSYLSDGGILRALVVARQRAQLVGLGSVAIAAEAIARLRGDLDALCGRQLPAVLRNSVRTSLRHHTQILTDHLITPLRPLLGNSQLLVVPTGTLSALPWGLLPDLRGRPVTVSPSASTWRATRHAARQPPRTRTVLVAGPNLDCAPKEITALAEVYPNGTVLQRETATVAAALHALEGCHIAHIAAHGHHEQNSVLFSRLDLHDGPLLAYDIHQLGAAPEHVVLSSCDIGRTIVRSGDEILGFTAALLYSGTRTVISSVAKLDDARAVPVMTAYHRALNSGVPPAEALAKAMLIDPLVPLVCFGG